MWRCLFWLCDCKMPSFLDSSKMQILDLFLLVFVPDFHAQHNFDPFCFQRCRIQLPSASLCAVPVGLAQSATLISSIVVTATFSILTSLIMEAFLDVLKGVQVHWSNFLPGLLPFSSWRSREDPEDFSLPGLMLIQLLYWMMFGVHVDMWNPKIDHIMIKQISVVLRF